MTNTNPLLQVSSLPHRAVDFTKITDDLFLPAKEEAVKMARENIAKIKSQEKPDFANTIEALEFSSDWFNEIALLFSNLFSAHTSDKLQELAPQMGAIQAELKNDIYLDEDLFARVKTVYEKRQDLKLNAEQLKLLEETYQGFERNGANLNDKDKARLREIDNEMAQLAPAFSNNCLKATNAFELKITDEDDLAGLPESAVAAALHAAAEKGYDNTWLFTLQAPSFIPFMKYSDKRELREKLVKAHALNNTSGEFDNRQNVKRIVEMRHEKAQLLGFKTHAQYVLAHRMAETSDRVFDFLNELLVAAKPAADKELKELQEFATEMGGPNPMMSWDYSYYAEKLKHKKFHFDEEELRPYFKLEKVIDGAFEVATRLYNVEFKATDQYPTYHEDVRVFEVYDKSNNDFVGLFYADFFPRDTKRAGAWMTNFREQGYYHGDVHRPHVSIVCNFTKPTPDKPSLLTFMEVRTLFHEFGHALHSLLTKCSYQSLSGTNVYWDFVELPSQVLENWTLEKEALDLFAEHYETGEKIPQSLVDKLIANSKFHAGYFSMRQLNFGFLDMAWHTTSPDKIDDVLEFEKSATEKTQVLPRIEGGCASVGFGHIFAGGYSAGYYSYKWAEVLDADAFEYFKEKGIFDGEVAKKFKQNVLERGGTEHPMELYKKFRGREPDTKALLRRDGLI